MSTENLKVVITGDASDLDKAGAEAQKALDGVSKSAAEWDKRARALNQQMNYTDRGLQKIGTAAAKIPPVATHVEQGFRRMSGATNQANFAMISLSQGIGDIPYGFTAIANNVQQTIQGFTYLQRTTGSTGAALKSLGRTLIGPTGLFVGISVVSALITGLVQKYGSLGNAAQALFGHLSNQEKAQKALNKAIEDGSKEISSSITGLLKVKSIVGLAANGYVSAKTAVDNFNKTLGDSFGKVTSLTQAQKELTDGSAAFIQATIYKTAAQKLFSQASDAVVKNIQKQNEADADAATFGEKIASFLSAYASSPQWTDIFKNYRKLRDEFGKSEKSLSQLTAQNSVNKLSTQAQQLQQIAAKIAKQFNINLFGIGGSKGGASGKGAKTISDILNNIKDQFATINSEAKIYGLSIEQIATNQMKALDKGMKDLATIHTPAAIEAAKKLGEQYAEINKSSFLPTLSGGRAQVNDPSPLGGNSDVPTYINPEVPKDVTNGIKTNSNETQNWAKAANELNNAFEGVFSSIINGGNAFQSIAQAVEQLIAKLLAAAAAAAVLTALTGGSFTAAASVAGSFKNLFGQFSGIKLASGGFVGSPTIAMVGDAPGGEWVLNQRQISAILNGSGGGRDINVTGRIEAEGSTLQVILDNANKKTNRRN